MTMTLDWHDSWQHLSTPDGEVYDATEDKTSRVLDAYLPNDRKDNR